MDQIPETQKSKSKPSFSILKVYFPNFMTWFILINFYIVKTIQENMFTELPKIGLFNYGDQPIFVGFFLFLSTVYVLPVALLPVKLKTIMKDKYIL